jgi:protocatechuate 3,4-dioxygenase beta subunit
MKSRVLSLCPILYVMLLCGMPAWRAAAEPQSKSRATIEGRVFSASGYAVEGARVTVQDSDGRNPRTTVTNSQGLFRFPMRPGLYDVRATAKGRSTEWRQNVNVNTGRPTTITLHLQPKPPSTIKPPASHRKP